MFLRLRGSTFQNDPSQWKDGAWGEMMSERKSKASKPGKEMVSQKHPSYAGKKEQFKMIQAKERAG